MGVSRRKYAEMRGVSHTAVGKAIASGRITTLPDGSIDPAVADRQWDQQTDPAKQRGSASTGLGIESGRATRAETKPVPKAAIEAVSEILQEAGQEPKSPPGSAGGEKGEVSFLRARMANEVIKAQTAKVRLAKMNGDLVDRAKATTMVFELARQERDAWQNWPPRIAANMAAELGVDPHLLEKTLEKYLRTQLAQLAEVKLELR
jgi:hypothetical protein